MTNIWDKISLKSLIIYSVISYITIFSIHIISNRFNNEYDDMYENKYMYLSDKVVQFPIYHEKYVKIRTGIPGKIIKYYIDFSLNDTYLFDNSNPILYSSTYDGQTDVLHFNHKLVRIKINTDYPKYTTSATLNDFVSFDGILGLGEGSDILKIWPNIIIDSYILRFGFNGIDNRYKFYNHILFDNIDIKYYNMPIYDSTNDDINGNIGFGDDNNINYKIHLNLSESHNIIPTKLMSDKLLILCNKKYITYDGNNDNINILNNIYFKSNMTTAKYNIKKRNYDITKDTATCMILRDDNFKYYDKINQMPFIKKQINKNSDNDVIFGHNIIGPYALQLFYNLDEDKNSLKRNYVLWPTFKLFIPEFPSRDLNLYFELLLGCIFSIWFIIVRIDIVLIVRTKMLLNFIQLFGCNVCIVCLIYNINGINIYYLFINLMNYNGNSLLYFTFLIFINCSIIFSILILVFIDIVQLFNDKYTNNIFENPNEQDIKFRRDILHKWDIYSVARKSLFETMILLTWWISSIEYHTEPRGFVFLIFISVILCNIHLSYFYMILSRNLSYLKNCTKNKSRYLLEIITWVIHAFFIAICILFLFKLNLEPYLILNYFNNPLNFYIKILFFLITVAAPSLILFIRMERAHIFYILYSKLEKNIL